MEVGKINIQGVPPSHFDTNGQKVTEPDRTSLESQANSTQNKPMTKYQIAKEIKDWFLAFIFCMWGGNFIYEKFINPPNIPKPEPQIKIERTIKPNPTEIKSLK